MTAAIATGALLLVVALWAILTRNSMVAARNRVDEAWSGAEVQLRRRHDLVPNLVEAVAAYAVHERATLDDVTVARWEAADAVRSAAGPTGSASAETRLAGSLARLRGIAERYPELRASESFVRLQAELTGFEAEISASRQIYNSNVRAFNSKIAVFPNSLVAGLTGFEPRDFFEPGALSSQPTRSGGQPPPS